MMLLLLPEVLLVVEVLGDDERSCGFITRTVSISISSWLCNGQWTSNVPDSQASNIMI